MSFEQLDLDQIQDVAQAKRAIVGLLNLVEDLQATVRELQGAETIDLLHIFGLPQSTVRSVQGLPRDQDWSAAEFTALLDARLPSLGPQPRSRILEAAVVAAYHAQTEFPIVKLLLCDDAPQFNWVTEQLALCWIHEGRH